MTLVFKILTVAALHLALFSAYPETGPFGNYYLGISLLVWSVFIAFVNTGARLVKFFSGAAGLVINLAAFALMALALTATMPQSDRASVLEKLQKGSYPDRDTLKTGLRRFGINLDKDLSGGAKELEKKAGKAMKKLKE